MMATTKNLNCLWNYHHCHCIQKLHFSSSQHSYDCSPLEPFDWRCAAGCECPISNTINAITVLVFTIISTIRIFIILLFYYLFIFICTRLLWHIFILIYTTWSYYYSVMQGTLFITTRWYNLIPSCCPMIANGRTEILLFWYNFLYKHDSFFSSNLD